MKQAQTQRLVVPQSKPRNPLVAAALQRKAGSHTKPHKSQRQHDKVQLKKQQGQDPFQSAWTNSHHTNGFCSMRFVLAGAMQRTDRCN